MEIKKFSLTIVIFLVLVLSIQLSLAVIINSVDSPTLTPGKEGTIRIEIKNILDDNAKDVSLTLQFNNIPFIPIGTSEQSEAEIREDDDEDFFFGIKASPDIPPGDYEIPYVLQYEINGNVKSKTGTIGIKVVANPDLTFSITTETPVLSEQGKISLKIVNKGFYDARFVSVKIEPEGFTLLSEKEMYVGSVDSDDFETATFDVIFNKKNPKFIATLEYKDFDNSVVTKEIELPLKVYTEDEALQLGIIKRSNTSFYIALVVAVILIIILWRTLRKRQRMRKSMMREKNEEEK